MDHERPILAIAPMEIERSALAHALQAAGLAGSVEVLRSGVGRERIVATLEAAAGRRRRPPRMVILAGCAGALTDVPLNHAAPITRVVSESGQSWTPTRTDPHPTGPAATLLAVDRLIDQPSEKRALHARTGASLVDMESHALAEWCERRGWPWAVARGVSDGPDHRVPGIVLSWLNPDGTSRAGKAAADLAIRPWLWGQITTLVRHTGRATALAGAQAARLAQAALDTPAETPT